MADNRDLSDQLVEVARRRLYDHYRSMKFWDSHRGERRFDLFFQSFLLALLFGLPIILVFQAFPFGRWIMDGDAAARVGVGVILAIIMLLLIRSEYRSWLRLRDYRAEEALTAADWETACDYLAHFGWRWHGAPDPLEARILERMEELRPRAPRWGW